MRCRYACIGTDPCSLMPYKKANAGANPATHSMHAFNEGEQWPAQARILISVHACANADIVR